ncbi:putative disease resistance protein RGA4 [Momordica charantia]|uniref:Disease resistance protein RGA4 n=1 Tax=Momordica charantia TaxID=3673 RepID=A0A6J1D168_MOMCH|nr:putative disease resistance protein RGA4 [Momordica charantia]
MAEGVLFHVAGEILMKLGSIASQRLGMVRGVENDLTKLTSTVSVIKNVLLDAEEHCQTKTDHTLQDWLQKLEEALYDAEDVLDELSSETLHREVVTKGKNAKQVRIFFSGSNQIAFNYRVARNIKKIWERLDAIDAERKQFNLTENCQQRTLYGSFDQIMMGRKETCSFPNVEEVIGRDYDKKKLKDLLLDINMNVRHNVSFIVIAGMGGIGKTTLAKSLYHDREVSECFDSTIWIWISDQFEVRVVVEKIIESATKRKPNVEGMEALNSELQEVIGGKKYLLVMDDVWKETEEKWHELKPLLMGGASGSKILITKRDSKVATEIESMTSLFTLKGLQESNSWSLFRKVAFKEAKDPANSNLIKLGKEILAKCGGVPLVIRHIGRLLYSKTSEEEWMSFKNNELLKVIQQTDKNDGLTPILNLSYNHLPPNLKQCFAYLSLFPKGTRLEIKDLIRQWMAHGFIESSNGTANSMEEVGKSYFKELCWRFFFENSSDECNFDDDVDMHDVMREVAMNVAGEKYVHGNLNCDFVVSEKTRHILFDSKIKLWQDVLLKLQKAKGLRTFLFLSYFPFKNRLEDNIEAVLEELCSSFPRLRVLGLNHSKIHVVPNSIKNLRHLRYLNLSRNYMESLPTSITKLQNLQSLDLKDCYKLNELPRDTSNLVNLRHLVLPDHLDTPLHMLEGMRKLSCLRTLGYFVLDCKRSNMQSELNVPNYFNGRLKIVGLEQLRRTPSKVGLVNLKDIQGLRDLKLVWKLSGRDDDEGEGKGDERVMEGLQPQSNVESLRIEGYSGVGLPNWVSTSLSNLTKIAICNCHRVQHLPQLAHLQTLKGIFLEDMRSLKFVDKNEPGLLCFPSLVSLRLKNMGNLEGWWESRVVGETLPIFPELQYLRIQHCPKLSLMPKIASSTLDSFFLCDVGVQVVTAIGPLWNFEVVILQEIKDLKDLEMESHQNRNQDLGSSSLSMSSRSPTRLRFLTIEKCSNLMSLPEWIGTITSLWKVTIIDCPKLKSLLEGMRQLKSLKYLTIKGCPELEERCKEGGEDWPNIAHIPILCFSEEGAVEAVETAEIAESGIWRKMKDFIPNIRSSLTCGC